MNVARQGLQASGSDSRLSLTPALTSSHCQPEAADLEPEPRSESERRVSHSHDRVRDVWVRDGPGQWVRDGPGRDGPGRWVRDGPGQAKAQVTYHSDSDRELNASGPTEDQVLIMIWGRSLC